MNLVDLVTSQLTGDVLGKLAQFPPDFMSQGRGDEAEDEREAL